MAQETANRAAERLLPASLLPLGTREYLLSLSMPGLLVDGTSGAVLWSSHAAARRLGATDGGGLIARGLPVFAPGTRRLAALARGLDAASPRSLERLRFNSGFRSHLITALCEPLMLVSGKFALLVSFVDATPARNDAASSDTAPPDIAPVTGRRHDDEAEPVLPFGEPMADAAAVAVPEAVSISPVISDAAAPDVNETDAGTPAWLALPASERRVMRFVFGLDANGVVQRVTPPLAEAVGEKRAEIAGRPLAAIVQEFDPEAAEAIRSAVLSGETWSGVSVRWPVAETGISVPIELSALPQTNAEEGLTGYSGFGRCHLARAETAPATSTEPDADMPKAQVDDTAPDETDLNAFAGGNVDISEAVGLSDTAGVQASPVSDSATATAEAEDLATALDAFGTPDEGSAAAEPEATGTHDAATARETGPAFSDVSRIDIAASARPDSEPGAQAEADEPTDAVDTPGIAAVSTGAAADPDHTMIPDAPPAAPASPVALPEVPRAPANVVSLRTDQPEIPASNRNGLSMSERNAFREIARALGAKFDEGDAPPPRPDQEGLPSPARDKPADMEFVTERRAAAGTEAPADASPAAKSPSPVIAGPLLDRLPIGLLVLGGDEALYANGTLLDLTGYPDFRTFVEERGAQAIFRKGTMPRDRESGFDTITLATREGELIPVDAHLQLTEWEGARATLVSFRRAVELEQGKALRSVALDLKRVRAEAQELRAVLDTATDGVATLDEKGRILSVNGAAEALFGLDQREVVGESFTVLLHNESHADALDYFEGLRANGVRSVLNDGRDVFGREKKGGRIPLFMTLGRISDDEPRRYCAVLRDLTSWKRAETELTDARRSAELASAKKSDFLTKISHEIRTPMNAIIGFAEVMIEERLGPIENPKYKEYLGDIRTSGKHVVSLVNDLLDLSKIEAGRMEMSFAATDLNAIVSSSVGIIQPQANQNRVLVRTQLATRLPSVVADERSIRQIILNMLSNATRFTESGGQVIVATALLDTGEAVIRIRDTGVGMSAGEIEQALEPFRQVGTRRNQGGTGLGLPLTKALVEANRANFAIRSTPGEGTMVEITFPSTRVLAE